MVTAKTKTSSRQYTNYYLVMLILTTVFAISHLAMLQEIPRMIQHFSVAPIYISLQLVATASLALTVTSLILLYQKRRIGLTLFLIDCAFGLIYCIIAAFLVDQITAYTVATLSTSEQADKDFIWAIKTIYPYFIYGMIIIQGLINFGAALLWRDAWNKQAKADRSKK